MTDKPHEIRHLLTDAVACVEFDAPYDEIDIHISGDEQAMEGAGEHEYAISAIGALGPVIEHPASVWLEAAKEPDWAELQQLGILSDEDMKIAQAVHVDRLVRVRVLLGAQALERRLTSAGFDALCGCIQDELDPIPLATWVPRSAAEQALAEAENDMQKVVYG
ncbi:hypothetical protein [Sedimentitalea sp.]|uniref:hypothetical protein n=1 Tax=Sedimentitalea sp. TaxID=2048915 RepID=UPI003298EF2E